MHRETGPLEGYLFLIFYDPVEVKQGGRFLSVPPPGMLIYHGNAAIHYGNRHHPWLYSWIHAKGPFLDRRVKASKLPLNTVFSLTEPLLNDKYLVDLYNEISGHSPPDRAIVCGIIDLWLRDLKRSLSGPSAGPLPRAFAKAGSFIQMHFNEAITLGALAADAGMCPDYFGRRFKHYFGLSPIDYMIRIRMVHAMHLLRDCNRNINEVAVEVGYANARHFSRLFSKHFGVKPSDVQKKGSISRRFPISQPLLSHASLLLTESDLTLPEIVEKLGFPDMQTFSRFYMDNFGRSPEAMIAQRPGNMVH